MPSKSLVHSARAHEIIVYNVYQAAVQLGLEISHIEPSAAAKLGLEMCQRFIHISPIQA